MLFPTAKGIDPLYLLIRQFKVEQLRALLNMVGIARAGKHHHALWEIPAQDDPGRRHALSLGNLRDRRMTSSSAVCLRPPRGISALHHDAHALDVGDYIVFLVVGVYFVLCQCGRYGHLGQKLIQLLHIPVGKADGADFTHLHSPFHRPVRLHAVGSRR